MHRCSLMVASGVRLTLLAGLAALFLGWAGSTRSQEVIADFYREPGINPTRDYVNQHVNENIDPFTGALQLQFTDIVIPGPAGFDLKVVRSFSSNRINPVNPAAAAPSALMGLGWTVHFGRVLKKGNTSICTIENYLTS